MCHGDIRQDDNFTQHAAQCASLIDALRIAPFGLSNYALRPYATVAIETATCSTTVRLNRV